MQFIEVSLTGVRSAVITLSARGQPQRVVLFPMLHLATPDFYTSVAARLGSCRVILAEGIAGNSLVAGALTSAYRLPARRDRLGLVAQNIDYARLQAEVIAPDLTGRQLRSGWRALPFLPRAALFLLAPVMGAVFWLRGSRRTLARFAAAEDLPDPALVMLRDRAPGLMRLLLDDRDAQLAAALDQVLARTSDGPADIAVVYGAAHMPALTRHLQSRYGFRPRAADWLTVFDF